MTNTFNIAGADGNVMVPVLSETSSLMAYLLYPDPTGILQELYSCMGIFRQSLEHNPKIPRQSNTHSSSIWGGTLYQGAPFMHKNAFGCTGQPIIPSQTKIKSMAKTTSSASTSADRIKNDPAFERTRENMAEFSRAGKAAKLLRTILPAPRMP